MEATMSNKGETLTFLQMFKEKGWKIKVPIIQRDYAQGRVKSKDIRDLFLNTLYQHLQNGNRIDLDFVYGSIVNDGNFQTFVPLDGQQRLTTLFLLHWYLSNHDGEFENFSEIICGNGKSKFTYETRISSSEFFDCLCSTQMDFSKLLPADENTNNSFSKTIKNLPWFFNSWNSDQTVRSVMTMLDDIHTLFGPSQGLYEKLSSASDPLISFQFLNLEAFELTDDLYIKMNARGKLLSPFENFKAWLQNYILENKIEVGEKDWELNLDIKWMNMFWDYRGADIEDLDNSYYNFFKNIGLYTYLTQLESSKGTANRDLINALDNAERIALKSFEDNSYFLKPSLDFIFKSLNTLNDIGFIEINQLLSDIARRTSLKNVGEIAQLIVGKENNPILPLRVFIYAVLRYLTSVEKGENLHYERNFKRWIRVCYNLIFNTYIQNPDNLSNAIQSIARLSANQERIYDYLASEDAEITFFNTIQRDEELLKAKLIVEDSLWEEHFIRYEEHSYFNGQIGFIFEIAIADNFSPEDFIPYAEKSAALFSARILDHSEFLFQRALLSKKNYFVKDGINSSFCINNIAYRDKEENWRKVLRDKEKLAAFKSVADEIEVGKEEKGLREIINGYKSASWKKYFVQSPHAFQRCDKRIIRFEHTDILLFKTTRLYGEHAELKTYSYYMLNVHGKLADFTPFTNEYYFYNPRNEARPCFVLSGFKYKKAGFQLQVYYSGAQQQFEIIVFMSTSKNTNEIVSEILAALGMSLTASNNMKIYIQGEENLTNKLKELTVALGRLS